MFTPMKRIIVTQNELTRAILVWLRVAPKHVWRKFEAYERLMAEKRHNSEDAPRAREELATCIAGEFQQAGSEISHPERHG
jgi:hypothetical protein